MNELKQLSTALAEHADRLERAPGVPYETCVRLTNIAERMEELAHEAQVEIDGLKAHVELLREAMENLMAFQVKHLDVWYNLPFDRCRALLKATPTQCLQEIKAQAVIDAINAHKNNLLTFDFNTAIRVTDLIQYANQLRQAAKGE